MAWRYIVVGWLALALAACAKNVSAHECSTGIVCEPPFQCAAVQKVCISNPCGNGVVDSGEQCDDGNIIDGDGCSATCQIEGCGNGVLDPGEVCDLGLANNGKCMGCSADCKSNEQCGNGVIDAECGEICDNGLNSANQCNGCDSTCKSTQVCGNGIVDHECGEVCDPPGVAGCQPGCRSSGTCGNGFIDPGEECDDGIDMGAIRFNCDTCSCRSDCIINRCGDGYQNTTGPDHKEECDGATQVAHGDSTATPTETPSCNADCTNASCGDGKINKARGEQCDSGTLGGINQNNNNANCTAACLVNVCGDGLPNSLGPPANAEQCDDGTNNGKNGDPCSLLCKMPSCGNGILEEGEECDLGNTNSDTGQCTLGCKLAKCGDNLVQMGVEACDPGAPGVNSATCNFDCTVATCGDSKLNPQSDFVGGVQQGTLKEQCDPPDATKGCSAQCQLVHCGNGVVDAGEQCDCGNGSTAAVCLVGGVNTNGNNANGPCLPNCTLAHCGDGAVETHSDSTPALEQCDQGVANGTLACPYGAQSCGICTSNCQNGAGTTAFCGDSICQNKTNGATATCGNPNVEACDNGAANGKTTCGYLSGSGHTTNTCTVCNSTCSATNTVNGPFCGDGACQNTTTGAPATCNTAGAEKCDNGALNGSTTCAYGLGSCTNCKSDCTGTVSSTGPFCGDNQTTNAETCDNGSNNGASSCPYLSGPGHASNTCTGCAFDCSATTNLTGPFCGDGAVTDTETCDFGPGFNGNGSKKCTYGIASCQVCKADCSGTEAGVGGFCGDNKCNDLTTGQLATCGDPNAEACDAGASNGLLDCAYNVASCTKCSATCTQVAGTVHKCGDNKIDRPQETCDGTDVDGLVCADFGKTGGSKVKCAVDCSAFDTSACN